MTFSGKKRCPSCARGKAPCFSQKVMTSTGSQTLPEQVAQIAVRTDLFTTASRSFMRVQDYRQRVRVHLEGEALTPCSRASFCGISSNMERFFFPLPVLHLGIFGGPAVSNPVRLGILRSAAGQPEKPTITLTSSISRAGRFCEKRINIFCACLASG